MIEAYGPEAPCSHGALLLSIQPDPTQLDFPVLKVQDGIGATAILIAWLGTRARVDDRHLVDALDHGDMRMPKDDKIIGKLCEAGELGTAGKDILFKGLPGTRVHHQEACPRKVQLKRDRGCGQGI